MIIIIKTIINTKLITRNDVNDMKSSNSKMKKMKKTKTKRKNVTLTRREGKTKTTTTRMALSSPQPFLKKTKTKAPFRHVTKYINKFKKHSGTFFQSSSFVRVFFIFAAFFYIYEFYAAELVREETGSCGGMSNGIEGRGRGELNQKQKT